QLVPGMEIPRKRSRPVAQRELVIQYALQSLLLLQLLRITYLLLEYRITFTLAQSRRVRAIRPIVSNVAIEITGVAFKTDRVRLKEPSEIRRHEAVAIVVETDLDNPALASE